MSPGENSLCLRLSLSNNFVVVLVVLHLFKVTGMVVHMFQNLLNKLDGQSVKSICYH